MATSKHSKLTRDKARSLYLLGNDSEQISLMTGVKADTVRQWVSRHGWAAEKRMRTTEDTKALQIVSGLSSSDLISAHEKLVHDTATSHIDTISKLKTVNSKELVNLGQALKHFDDVGRRNLGLSNDATEPRQNFHVHLGNMQFEEKKAVEIDVTPVPE